MEIRNYEDITGVITTADVVEGRFGLMTTHTFSADYGSRTDLPGFKVPATAEEAKVARYVITWAVDNTPFPQYKPIPSYSFGLRQGFGQAGNAPFSATVYLSNPANQNGVTIPSGTPSLAFGRGVYTVTSGNYIASANLVAGAKVIVANTAEDTTDAGKLKYQSTMDERVIGLVRQYDSTTQELTVQILY